MEIWRTGHAPGDTSNPQELIAADANPHFTSAFGALADMAAPRCQLDPVAIDPKRKSTPACAELRCLGEQ